MPDGPSVPNNMTPVEKSLPQKRDEALTKLGYTLEDKKGFGQKLRRFVAGTEKVHVKDRDGNYLNEAGNPVASGEKPAEFKVNNMNKYPEQRLVGFLQSELHSIENGSKVPPPVAPVTDELEQRLADTRVEGGKKLTKTGEANKVKMDYYLEKLKDRGYRLEESRKGPFQTIRETFSGNSKYDIVRVEKTTDAKGQEIEKRVETIKGEDYDGKPFKISWTTGAPSENLVRSLSELFMVYREDPGVTAARMAHNFGHEPRPVTPTKGKMRAVKDAAKVTAELAGAAAIMTSAAAGVAIPVTNHIENDVPLTPAGIVQDIKSVPDHLREVIDLGDGNKAVFSSNTTATADNKTQNRVDISASILGTRVTAENTIADNQTQEKPSAPSVVSENKTGSPAIEAQKPVEKVPTVNVTPEKPVVKPASIIADNKTQEKPSAPVSVSENKTAEEQQAKIQAEVAKRMADIESKVQAGYSKYTGNIVGGIEGYRSSDYQYILQNVFKISPENIDALNLLAWAQASAKFDPSDDLNFTKEYANFLEKEIEKLITAQVEAEFSHKTR